MLSTDSSNSFHSKKVSSNQLGIHKKLTETVKRHINSEFQKPIRKHNLEAFDSLKQYIDQFAAEKLILDSGCGTGMSTRLLAKNQPDALVIGIDQSFHRLSKHVETAPPANCLLLQANCEDIWRLCLRDDITFNHHYILYPNPWPKSVHLKRRWHGHPAFVYLKDLAHATELRSNWKLYLEEFQHAWRLLNKENMTLERLRIKTPLTLFERKYHGSGQALFKLATP